MLLNLIIFLIAVFFLTMILSYGLSGLSIAPWIPCRKKDLERINRLANLESGQIFFELGCGDGRVSRYIAKQNPESKVIGIEIYLPIFLLAKTIQLFLKQDNLVIKFGDAFKEDLTKVDVIYTFALIKSINGKLKNKFERELKEGAKILSYVFSIQNWRGKKSVDKPYKKTLPIYTYENK